MSHALLSYLSHHGRFRRAPLKWTGDKIRHQLEDGSVFEPIPQLPAGNFHSTKEHL